jgi:hypothetical protein
MIILYILAAIVLIPLAYLALQVICVSVWAIFTIIFKS